MSNLITSTSWFSRSDRVPLAFKVAGGGSIAAIFFLFLAAKKDPKKPSLDSEPSVGRLGEFDLGGTDGGRGLPVFGSTCVGLLALWRSLTMAMARWPLRKSGWPVLM